MQLIRPTRRSAPPVALDFEWSGIVDIVDDLQFERGVTITGEPVQLISPHTEPGLPHLRTEIEIGVQLARSFAEDMYPAQLSRLIGYDTPQRPRGVVVTCAGEPLTPERVETIATKDLPALAESLLTGLQLLADAHVVHRVITPERLLWDGTALQITGFRQAVVTPPAVRRHDGLNYPPWTSPEQLAGAGQISHTDDLYGAVAVLWWLYTREQPGAAATMPGRIALQSDDLKGRMAGMFAARAAERPSLSETRRRWHPVAAPSPRTPALEQIDREAVKAFAALRLRQREERSVELATAPMFREDRLVRAAPATARGVRIVALLVVMAVLATVFALYQAG